MMHVIECSILQDILYNPTTGTGYLESKLRYNKNVAKKASALNVDTVAEHIDGLELTEDGNDIVDLAYFKSCVYDKDSRIIIKEKLRRSVKERCQLLKTPHLDIRANFPCLILHPELVYFYLF